MSHVRSSILLQVLAIAASVVIIKVTGEVVLGYRNYAPPNFSSDFLHGREAYFASRYQWAFYPHLVSGPVSLLVGLVLFSERLRRRFPQWHRRLGRVQVGCVLLLVAPSGLVMAYDAQSGPVAAVAFAGLALSTAGCTALGWRAAMQRRFAVHRRWMQRSYLLLCSAVVLRVIGGIGTVLNVSSLWFDPLAAWACWVGPWVLYEFGLRWTERRAPDAPELVLPSPRELAR